jgi:CHAT domain-containing protein
LDKNKIENLIIRPDGDLAKLPFETLFTEKYTATWTNWQNKTYFSEMPYLIKKYNISYNYSATLFAQTEKNKLQNKNIAKYDWVGFAPVFDDANTAGTNQNSARLLTIESNKKDDEYKTRTFLKNGRYINPLPASKDEVINIFNIFNDNQKTAKVYTHLQANEQLIKSDEIQNYKIIHLATHGIVNEFKPELSAVLLAQDTTAYTDSLNILLGNVAQQNEGFLYQSEIYNLKFNADLVVLSACETGLGKVSKGEGVIGLTRAFLYAGADNLIVSLWQVSDKATQLLMVDFYKNYLSLNKKKQKKFAPSLRNAKLEMIKQGFHPYLWSSFILIGE